MPGGRRKSEFLLTAITAKKKLKNGIEMKGNSYKKIFKRKGISKFVSKRKGILKMDYAYINTLPVIITSWK